MITVTVFKDSGIYRGFRSEGHAGYAEEGFDIICSAVSVLTINTLNSIEAFTEDGFSVEADDGMIDCRLEDEPSEKTILLMDSMVLGLQDIQNNYGNEYIKLIFEEV